MLSDVLRVPEWQATDTVCEPAETLSAAPTTTTCPGSSGAIEPVLKATLTPSGWRWHGACTAELDEFSNEIASVARIVPANDIWSVVLETGTSVLSEGRLLDSTLLSKPPAAGPGGPASPWSR